jgi:hypothetical protein
MKQGEKRAQVGRRGEFEIYVRAYPGEGDWQNFILRRGRRRPPTKINKHSWWLSWNGQRFYGSADYCDLRARLPGVFKWVRTRIRKEYEKREASRAAHQRWLRAHDREAARERGRRAELATTAPERFEHPRRPTIEELLA